MTSKYKRIAVDKSTFPQKVKIVKQKTGRPKRLHGLKKPEVYEEFARWCALPSPLREPKTQTEFAEKWGVAPLTLILWKKKQDWWETMLAKRAEWARDKTSDVIHGLYKTASTRGQAAEVKLWLQFVEGWTEKEQQTGPQINILAIQGVSNDELQKLVQPEDKSSAIAQSFITPTKQEEVQEAEVVSESAITPEEVSS